MPIPSCRPCLRSCYPDISVEIGERGEDPACPPAALQSWGQCPHHAGRKLHAPQPGSAPATPSTTGSNPQGPMLKPLLWQWRPRPFFRNTLQNYFNNCADLVTWPGHSHLYCPTANISETHLVRVCLLCPYSIPGKCVSLWMSSWQRGKPQTGLPLSLPLHSTFASWELLASHCFSVALGTGQERGC